MGLIARQLEAAGIVTTSVSAARDVTAAARLPRAVFVDFPHGHTTGRVGDPALTRSIVESALGLLPGTEPEQLVDLAHRWSDADDWKDSVFLPRTADDGEKKVIDDRVQRFDTPQYQLDTDADAAAAAHAAEQCVVCAGIDY